MRKQEGITLIALVITIIVLLILAGVTIAMLTGDNGLLTRATQAGPANDIGNAKDMVALKASEGVTEYYKVTYAASEGETTTYTSARDAAIKAGLTATSPNVTIAAEGTDGIKVTSTKDTTKYATGTLDANGALTWENHY